MTAATLVASAKDFNGYKLLVTKVEGIEAKALRSMAEGLRNQLGDSIVVLASVNDGKVQIVAGVSKPLVSRVKAGELAGFVASKMGGKGGGGLIWPWPALPRRKAWLKRWLALKVSFKVSEHEV